MITRLTPHFTLEELIATSHRGVDNTPDRSAMAALRLTAERMETVRSILGGKVITVTSGFRSKALNRKVGGSPTSAHVLGYAVDFNCFGFGTPYQVCKALEGRLQYDQLIHEFGRWIHIGFGPGQRGQELTAKKVGRKTVYLAGIQRV